MFQIHKYDTAFLRPLEKLAEARTYGEALMRMDALKGELRSFCELCIVDSSLIDERDHGILWRTVPCLFVVLEAWGNPDMGQGRGRIANRRTVAVRDLEHASQVCLQWIASEGLGAGNWVERAGDVSDASGTPVACVSYNGNVWEPGGWRPGRQPLFSPPGVKAPAPPQEPPAQPSTPFKVGDRVWEVGAKGDPTPYTVKAVSPSGTVLTLVHHNGCTSIVRAHRTRDGRYRVKDGALLRHPPQPGS